MTREEGIKKFTEIVKIMNGKTIFTDDFGNICVPPNPYDYCIDDLMIFNHGKLEAYKSVLKMFEDEVKEETKC
jgi:hypothetical protein